MNTTLPAASPSDLTALLARHFGFDAFRHGQEEIVRTVLERRDAVVVMPTGAGKSLCYQLPALVGNGVTLVISPLIALMKDQVDALERRGLAATFVNSSLDPARQGERLYAVRSGRVRLLYVAPERFGNRGFLEAMSNVKVDLFAIDEAHCISQWGHDFRPSYLRLAPAIKRMGRPPVIALTATATPDVRKDIVEHLGLVDPRVFVTGFDRPNLSLSVRPVKGQKEKLEELATHVRKAGTPGIVYAATRKRAEDVTHAITRSGVPAVCYHAGLTDRERTSVQEQFMTGRAKVIVATNAFGMGVDKADVRFVAHHDLPRSIEAYYQEAGRAGRDGRPSSCLLLYSPADVHVQTYLIESSNPSEEVVRAVYDHLWDAGEREFELSLDEIAKRLPVKANGMAVGAAMRILAEAGHIERGTRKENRASVRLLRNPSLAGPFHGPGMGHARVVLDALVGLGARMESLTKVLIEDLAEVTDLAVEKVRTTLVGLDEDRTIEYVPPFRGRATRLVGEAKAALVIDHAKIRQRAEREFARLDLMVGYAEAQECRRDLILGYFGEALASEGCQRCDVCESRSKNRSGARPVSTGGDLLAVLACVRAIDGRFGRHRIAQVLEGSTEDDVTSRRLDRLDEHGALSHREHRDVVRMIDRLIAQEYLAILAGDYPLVGITPKGREAMTRGQIDLPTLAPRPGGARRKPGAALPGARTRDTGPYDTVLFDALKRCRDRVAGQHGIRPTTLVPLRLLRRIARERPATVPALRHSIRLRPESVELVGEALVALVRRTTEPSDE